MPLYYAMNELRSIFHRTGAGRRMVVGGHNVKASHPVPNILAKSRTEFIRDNIIFFVWQLSLARWHVGFVLCTSPWHPPPHTDAEVKLKHTVNNGNGSLMSIKEIIFALDEVSNDWCGVRRMPR